MKKIFLILFIMAGFLSAQIFIVKKVKGDVKAQIGVSEKWHPVKKGEMLKSETTLMTNKNSNVLLVFGDEKFKIKNFAIVSLKDIKKLTTDDLLLALALGNLIDVPQKREKNKSPNTAVYGAEFNGNIKTIISKNDFGIMRLNGAKQLAENGYVESAIIEAMETYRKYPDTKSLSGYRIYFADLLVKKNLYDEALTEYKKINELKLDKKEKSHIKEQVTFLKKKLLK
ncbi:MAG: hypothetical protein IIB07_05270 [Bacteroidetes bacterium]|nr:hypothetical protein [Bacteroidota bacterium]MCH8942937.1 hypothetical protein [Bacteroidota bacterium]